MSRDASDPNHQSNNYIATTNHKQIQDLRESLEAINTNVNYIEKIDDTEQTPSDEHKMNKPSHNIQQSDDSSFNEPVPSEHPSPVDIDEINDLDLDLNIEQIEHIEHMEQHDEEEKQSSPTPTSNNNTLNIKQKAPNTNLLSNIDTNTVTTTNNIHRSAITPSTLYHLTHTLNLNDLPIHDIDEKEDYKDKTHTLSELFIAGGRKYWQNIEESANINENNFYVNAIATGSLDFESMFDDNTEIDLSALGLIEADDDDMQQITPSSSTKYHSAPSTSNHQQSPITPQPRPSQIISKNVINKLNIEQETMDDEYKEEHKETAFKFVLKSVSPTNIPIDNVPFGIAALFDDATHPNIIAQQITDDDDDDESPPILVPMRSFKDKGDQLESIEEQYKKAQREASNPEIIVPCSDIVGTTPTQHITIYEPIFEETTTDSREKSLSPDKNGARHSNSPSPDDTALKIDYQLETVAKSKIVRRLSFPLTKIDEIPLHFDHGLIIKEENKHEEKIEIKKEDKNDDIDSKKENETEISDHINIEFIDSVFNENKENLEKENEIRLHKAHVMIDVLAKDIDKLKDENNRLNQSKQDLVNRTSQQIEDLRDELQNMWHQLQRKDNEIKRLIHIGKEGYVPGDDCINNNNNNNSISSLWTSVRSKFSSSLNTLNQTKQSKIDLAIKTSEEIERLRDIIKSLSIQTNPSNSLIGASDPGSY